MSISNPGQHKRCSSIKNGSSVEWGQQCQLCCKCFSYNCFHATDAKFICKTLEPSKTYINSMKAVHKSFAFDASRLLDFEQKHLVITLLQCFQRIVGLLFLPSFRGQQCCILSTEGNNDSKSLTFFLLLLFAEFKTCLRRRLLVILLEIPLAKILPFW